MTKEEIIKLKEKNGWKVREVFDKTQTAIAVANDEENQSYIELEVFLPKEVKELIDLITKEFKKDGWEEGDGIGEDLDFTIHEDGTIAIGWGLWAYKNEEAK